MLLHDSFFQVNIFFETLMVETISETPEYTFLTFLSSVGGDLSLYLGITILSFMEIVEFIMRLFLSALRTLKTY